MFRSYSSSNPIRFLVAFGWIIAFCLAHHFSPTLHAQPRENINLEYTAFFIEYDNVFMFRPSLIQTVFYNIVDLKGNKTVARKKILTSVLGCQTESSLNPGCQIDRFRVQRKKANIPNHFTTPVSFSNISSRRYNKYKKIITLSWTPELIHPPNMTVEDFFNFVNAAKDSKYYRLKKGLKNIQLNTILEKKVEIVVENALAKNLIELYKHPRTDDKDVLVFVYDAVYPNRRYHTADFYIHLRASKVKINHQWFRTRNKSQ